MPKTQQKGLITLDIRTIVNYLNYISYVAFTFMILIPYTNPFNKIAVAVFTAVYSTQMLLFGFIVYFYTIISNPTTTSDDLDTKKGLISQLLNMPLRILSITFQFTKDIIIKILKKIGILSKSTNFDLSGSLLTYILVSFRKLLLFLCWAYISPNESHSIHYKGFLGFCFVNNVQQWFIIQLSETIKSKTRTNVGLINNIQSLLTYDKESKFHPSRLIDFLKFKRKFYYYISWALYCLYTVSMYKSQVEFSSHINDNYWKTILRPIQLIIIFCDIQFVKTFKLELSGINLKLFSFAEDHYLV